MTLKRLSLWLVGLLVAIGVPILGKLARKHQSTRCSLDGLPLENIYQVQIVNSEGKSRSFCCILCAKGWLARQKSSSNKILVTNETDGKPTFAQDAYFVESRVITNPITRNRIHVFREKVDALNHCQTFNGVICHPFGLELGLTP